MSTVTPWNTAVRPRTSRMTFSGVARRLIAFRRRPGTEKLYAVACAFITAAILFMTVAKWTGPHWTGWTVVIATALSSFATLKELYPWAKRFVMSTAGKMILGSLTLASSQLILASAKQCVAALTGENPEHFPHSVWIFTVILAPIFATAAATFAAVVLYASLASASSLHYLFYEARLNRIVMLARNVWWARALFGKYRTRDRSTPLSVLIGRLIGLFGIVGICFQLSDWAAWLPKHLEGQIVSAVVQLDFHKGVKFGLPPNCHFAYISDQRVCVAEETSPGNFSFNSVDLDKLNRGKTR